MVECLLVQPGDHGAETLPTHLPTGPSSCRRLPGPQTLPLSMSLMRVPFHRCQSSPVNIVRSAQPTVPTQLPTGTPVWSCSVHPAVGSAACVAGPRGPRQNAPGFPLSFGSYRPGSHSLPSAAPNWAEAFLRGHLRLLPSVLTTWEFGFWSLGDPCTPSPTPTSWSQSGGLRALCEQSFRTLRRRRGAGRTRGSGKGVAWGEPRPPASNQGFFRFVVRLLVEQEP